MKRLAIWLAVALPIVACGGKTQDHAAVPEKRGADMAPSSATPPATAGTADHGSPPAAPAATSEPLPGPAPLSSRGMPMSATPGPAASDTAGLHFDMPAGWTQQPISSSMRLAQAEIPGRAGSGQLAIFFFGTGGGGGVQANIDRWVGQMENAGKPQLATFETNGLKVTWVEVGGTLKASQMGMGPSTDQPGSRLFGAVVEGPGGPWFLKATGPDSTLAAERDHWLALLKSVRP